MACCCESLITFCVLTAFILSKFFVHRRLIKYSCFIAGTVGVKSGDNYIMMTLDSLRDKMTLNV